jgi:TPR repeat protein
MRPLIKIALLTVVFLIRASSARAQDFEAGVAAAKAGDYETALSVWRPLAEAGDPTSQFNLGMMYARGHGVAEDLAAAAGWFRKAAEQGQVDAQAHLGGMYARGMGVEQDYRQAAEWLYRAASRHHRQSQYELGTFYANGTGVERDFGAAYFWFTLAALQSYAPAVDAKIEMRAYMGPDEMMMVEQRAREWLQENDPAAPGTSGEN